MGEEKRRRQQRTAAEAANAFARVYREWPEVSGPIRGKLTICSIAHDDDCPALGTGIGCTCSPTVRHFLCPTKN
jgi:hypothetical protein